MNYTQRGVRRCPAWSGILAENRKLPRCLECEPYASSSDGLSTTTTHRPIPFTAENSTICGIIPRNASARETLYLSSRVESVRGDVARLPMTGTHATEKNVYILVQPVCVNGGGQKK